MSVRDFSQDLRKRSFLRALLQRLGLPNSAPGSLGASVEQASVWFAVEFCLQTKGIVVLA